MTNALRFNEDGLLPVIVQDALTNEVLMMAWANQEAYELMLSTGRTHFWSRSRQKLWMKGEESGHVQDIVSIQADCDDDTLWSGCGRRATPAIWTGPPASAMSYTGRERDRGHHPGADEDHQGPQGEPQGGQLHQPAPVR